VSVLFAVYLALGNAAPARADSGPSGFHPKVKWLYASAGLAFDYWRGGDSLGNGWAWRKKDNHNNAPQTLASITLGGSAALTPRVGLSLSVPCFYNRIEKYTDYDDFDHPSFSARGIGDIEIGIPVKVMRATLQPQLDVPGLYTPRFLRAWSGLGVYRASLGLSLPWKAHYGWASGETVVYKPGGGLPGRNGPMVEPWDYILKGGYAYKGKPLDWLHWKSGVDAAYNSLSWAGSRPQKNLSVEPRLGISYLPRPRQELSASLGATLYSWQGGATTFHSYGSRRIALGLYYGYYL
jgi:hypothetical protein